MQSILLGPFQIFSKFTEIFASQDAPPVSLVSKTPPTNLPPVSTTLAENFANSFASVVDTGGKSTTGVNINDNGGKTKVSKQNN